MDNRATRSMGVHVDKNAARLGSDGGERINRLSYISTASAAAQSRHMSTCSARVEQLLFFDIAGAAAEPYPPARARRRAKAALGGEGRADR